MSHQRTQCACACFKLEYISTSACRVVLDLQKVEWGWDYTVRTFVRVFVVMLDSLRLSDNFILVSKACKATKTINYDYFSLRFGFMHVNSIKQRLLQRRNPHFHINECLLCYSGSLIEITQLFTVSAHFWSINVLTFGPFNNAVGKLISRVPHFCHLKFQQTNNLFVGDRIIIISSYWCANLQKDWKMYLPGAGKLHCYVSKSFICCLSLSWGAVLFCSLFFPRSPRSCPRCFRGNPAVAVPFLCLTALKRLLSAPITSPIVSRVLNSGSTSSPSNHWGATITKVSDKWSSSAKSYSVVVLGDLFNSK